MPTDHRCAHCGDIFTPSRSDAVTCSARCRDGLYRTRKAEREAAYAARLDELLTQLIDIATPKETDS